MIKTQALTKIYTTEEVETTALNNITLEIKEGEYVAVMGPSGCGKSTIANKLSKELKVPHYDLDDIYWIKKAHENISELEL